MASPTAVQGDGTTVLDRAALSQECEVLAVEVPVTRTAEFLKKLKPILLDIPRVRTAVTPPEQAIPSCILRLVVGDVYLQLQEEIQSQGGAKSTHRLVLLRRGLKEVDAVEDEALKTWLKVRHRHMLRMP